MLNRVYIVVGVLAILALSAAFIVPRFVQWGDYRARMETMATRLLGAEVVIRGDIDFTLLPTPRLKFTSVAVGPAAAPVITVDAVEAEFSLLDFLRDRYAVNALTLLRPHVAVEVDESGLVSTGLDLTSVTAGSNLSISDARITDGTVTVSDRRSGATEVATAINGALHLQSWTGPLTFEGSGRYDARSFTGRFSTGELSESGSIPVSFSLRPADQTFSFTADGQMIPGVAPRFSGEAEFRQQAPAAENVDRVRGDLVLSGQFEATTDQILLSSYVLQPDENRAGTRLTGAAALHMGAAPSFEAVVSGGVAALPPRDATSEDGPQPYELVRLLDDLPVLPVPPVPGTIGVDLAEVGLRAFALRQVRIDASTDGKNWTIQSLGAELPGGTALQLSGRLTTIGERPRFTGRISISTERLDALAALWRKPEAINPLVNQPASLAAAVTLGRNELVLSNGTLSLAGSGNAFGLTLRTGAQPRLDLSAELSGLNAAQTTAFAAVLPEIVPDGAFEQTFPDGHVVLKAPSATLFGLEGSDLTADATWSGGVLHFTRLAAADLGGVGFDLSGTVGGSIAAPVVIASGSVAAADPGAPALAQLYDFAAVPQMMRDFIGRSLPAALDVELEQPDAGGAQVLTVTGDLGAGTLGLSAQLSRGLPQALSQPLQLTADLRAASAAELARQLGLGDASLLPAANPAQVRLSLSGTQAAGFDAAVVAEGSGDTIAYQGDLSFADGGLAGAGKITADLSAGDQLAQVIDAGSLVLPALTAQGMVEFAAGRQLSISGITGTAGDQDFGGALQLAAGADGSTLSGGLDLGSLPLPSLVAALTSPGSLTTGTGLWPDGALALGDRLRQTKATINVDATNIVLGGGQAIDAPSFRLVWNADDIAVRDFTGRLGDGTVGLDVTLCCAGSFEQKQASGRVSLTGVDLAALLPSATASVLGGQLTASARFDTTGDSIAALVGALGGEGSFEVTGLAIEKLDPGIFSTLAGLDNILDLDAEALTSIVAVALDQGQLQQPDLQGAFTVVGGLVRSQNLAITTESARLFGGLTLRLEDMSLGGSFALTPVGEAAQGDLINASTAQVTAELSGSLFEPRRELNLESMAAAIKVRAYELEVDRLEQLKAEDDARQEAAAEERTRLMAIEAQRRADEEAARRAADAAANPDPATLPAPLDFSFPQPIQAPTPSLN